MNKENVHQVFLCQHFAFPSIAGEELPEFIDLTAETEAAVSISHLKPATVLQNHGVSLDPEKFSTNTGYIPPTYPRPILENMEATSLAFLCRRLKIPFSALLCVTNTIDRDARREWKNNFKIAGEKLAECLRGC